MKTFRLAFATFLVAASVSACSSEGASPLAPSVAPSYDNGLVLGSGNRSDSTSTNTNTTTSTSTAENGLVLGSGN